MPLLNHRDFRLAKARIAQLERAIAKSAVSWSLVEQLPEDAANARRSALTAELDRLKNALASYEQLRSEGQFGDDIHAQDIGTIAIHARISRGLSQKDLAEKLEIKEQQIQRYERDMYRSVSLARYQNILNALGVELHPRLSADRKINPPREFIDLDLTPDLLRELRKRNWISLPRNTPPSLMKDNLARYIEAQSCSNRIRTLNRRTRSQKPVSAAIELWAARVLELANQSKSHMRGKFNIADTSWLSTLASLSTFPDGPIRAVESLRDHGIIFVYEPHLPGTLLDGAALSSEDNIPIVAVTLRHDRIDNFWFTLFHEIGHIYLHFGQELSEGFIDDDLGDHVTSDREREADDFARTRLIDDETWRSSPTRFTKSRDAVEKFARRLNIHPAIVAGRIRSERDFSLFSDMVGNGQVRKLFTAYPS